MLGFQYELCFFIFPGFLAPEHMREKRLVTFRMVAKKSKRQMSEKEATMADCWKKSKLLEATVGAYLCHHRETVMSTADANWGGRYFMNHE